MENITDNVVPTASQDFAYDDLNRLTNAQGRYGVLSYAYDKAGNRLNKSGTTVADYSYLDGTNKLAEVNSDEPISYSYDNAGNIIAKGDDGFVFNQANRVASVSRSSSVVGEYGYDGNNLRTVKAVNGETVYSLYDVGGNLLAEYDATGKVLREYAYSDGQRLTLFAYALVGGTGRGNDGTPPGQDGRPAHKNTPPGQDKSHPGQGKKGDHISSLPNLPPDVKDKVLHYYVPTTYYLISDHLGTGQMVVDDTAQVVWQADYQPFGQVDIVVNTLENDLRFPGQYYDGETGLHYNWNRYYDPTTGRYISADPIGLDGGINLYAYVGGNPVNSVDVMGLFVFGSRPLSGAPWIPLLSQCPTLDRLNMEVSHEHGFYEDGSGDNIGFSPGGPFREGLGGRSPHEFGYRMDYRHYDDDLMRQADQNVFDGDYSLLGCGPPEKNNCQDWAERLRDEYERLRRTTRPNLPRYTPIFTPMPLSP